MLAASKRRSGVQTFSRSEAGDSDCKTDEPQKYRDLLLSKPDRFLHRDCEFIREHLVCLVGGKVESIEAVRGTSLASRSSWDFVFVMEADERGEDEDKGEAAGVVGSWARVHTRCETSAIASVRLPFRW